METGIRAARKEIRYQVFISSPFDLKEIRAVTQSAVQQLGHFPMLMESAPAKPSTAPDTVRDAIHDSDIYVLILGSRYGSDVQDGGDQLGYTEWEFKVAREHGLPVLAFVQDREEVTKARAGYPADSPEMLNNAKFWEFYDRVRNGEVYHSQWSQERATELAINVTASVSEIALQLDKEEQPRGWIHASRARNIGVFTKSIKNELRADIHERFTDYEVLDDRCEEAKESKKALAKTFSNVFSRHIREKKVDLFLESGSTIAYVAQELGPVISSQLEFDLTSGEPSTYISTNNVLAELHLWLRNDVPCTFFPPGPIESPYGASYGPISRFGREFASKEPNYGRAKLEVEEKEKIERLLRMHIRPPGRENQMMIVAAVSGVQMGDSYDLEPTRGHSVDRARTAVQSCKGFHVGSYYNMLFKRYLCTIGHPMVVCLHYEKFNSPIKVGVCHFVFDEEFDWETFSVEHPLAFCIGCTDRQQDHAVNLLRNHGFIVRRPREGGAEHRGFVAMNQAFLDATGIVFQEREPV